MWAFIRSYDDHCREGGGGYLQYRCERECVGVSNISLSFQYELTPVTNSRLRKQSLFCFVVVTFKVISTCVLRKITSSKSSFGPQ